MSRQERINELQRMVEGIMPTFRSTYITLEATRRHCPEIYENGLRRFKRELLEHVRKEVTNVTLEDMDRFADFLLKALAARYQDVKIPKTPEELKHALKRGTAPDLSALLGPL